MGGGAPNQGIPTPSWGLTTILYHMLLAMAAKVGTSMFRGSSELPNAQDEINGTTIHMLSSIIWLATDEGKVTN